MSLLSKMKLKKLTIKAFATRARSGLPIGTFEAMFNPETFSQKYALGYETRQAPNSTSKQIKYTKSKARQLNLKLILDGSGVDEMGIMGFGRDTVSQRVKRFLDITFHMNGKIHQPNFLLVEWGGKEDGGLIFSCRLADVNVTYTSFDRDGAPLRAELDVNLIYDEDIRKRLAKENKSSPDLTHTRIVKAGDTLPLLTKEIYGDASHYLRVAQVNNLTDFRRLTPGQELFFPPLDSQARGDPA